MRPFSTSFEVGLHQSLWFTDLEKSLISFYPEGVNNQKTKTKQNQDKNKNNNHSLLIVINFEVCKSNKSIVTTECILLNTFDNILRAQQYVAQWWFTKVTKEVYIWSWYNITHPGGPFKAIWQVHSTWSVFSFLSQCFARAMPPVAISAMHQAVANSLKDAVIITWIMPHE